MMSWCCQGEISILRFMRGSSVKCLSDVAGLIFARLNVHRRRAFYRLSQLLELGSEGLELRRKKAALGLGDRLGRIDQRVEHHCDARQDRFLDPLEGFVETRLLIT